MASAERKISVSEFSKEAKEKGYPIAPSSVHNLVRRGQIVSELVGHKRMIPASEVERYVNRIPPASPLASALLSQFVSRVGRPRVEKPLDKLIADHAANKPGVRQFVSNYPVLQEHIQAEAAAIQELETARLEAAHKLLDAYALRFLMEGECVFDEGTPEPARRAIRARADKLKTDPQRVIKATEDKVKLLQAAMEAMIREREGK